MPARSPGLRPLPSRAFRRPVLASVSRSVPAFHELRSGSCRPARRAFGPCPRGRSGLQTIHRIVCPGCAGPASTHVHAEHGWIRMNITTSPARSLSPRSRGTRLDTHRPRSAAAVGLSPRSRGTRLDTKGRYDRRLHVSQSAFTRNTAGYFCPVGLGRRLRLSPRSRGTRLDT